MHDARKRRIWERERGACFYCRKPVALGPGIVFHHWPPLALMDEDLDEKVFPAHKACDAKPENTPTHISKVAKADRTGKKFRGEWRPSTRPLKGGKKMQSRPFPKGPKRPWPKKPPR